MTTPRPRGRQRPADPDADLLDDDDYEPVPRLPLSAASEHTLLLARRRAEAERNARLRTLRRAWGVEQ